MKKILLTMIFALSATSAMAEKTISMQRQTSDNFSLQQVQYLSHERIGSVEKVKQPHHNLVLYRGVFNVKIKQSDEQYVYQVPVTFSVMSTSNQYNFYNIGWQDASNSKIMKLLNDIDAKGIDPLDFEEKMRPHLMQALPKKL